MAQPPGSYITLALTSHATDLNISLGGFSPARDQVGETTNGEHLKFGRPIFHNLKRR
jgi:hypothetical protein